MFCWHNLVILFLFNTEFLNGDGTMLASNVARTEECGGLQGVHEHGILGSLHMGSS